MIIECPCKKCICLCICITKKQVNCTKFSLYSGHVAGKYGWLKNPVSDMVEYWNEINSVLPKLQHIRDNDGLSIVINRVL